VKEFVVYTGLRLLVLAATLAVVSGIWLLATDTVDVFWAVVISFVVSGVVSWFLLNRPRQALARHVEARAERATKAFEQRKAKEDVD
jgi:predicted PurR-regulated permease PerM